MSKHPIQRAARARMKVTGESYTAARLAVLAERGLSPTTPTSRNGLKRKQALLDADYPPEVLGVSPEPVWVWAPQPKHPPVEERVRGRVHAAGGGR